MKILLLPILSGICFLSADENLTGSAVQRNISNCTGVRERPGESLEINLQDVPFGKMSSIKFKAQDYCRAELPDFNFDVHFSVVGATVYFSGASFKGVEKGTITSNSLKPVRNLMDRCVPGSIVVFDDVKVKGPDNEVRTIPGISLTLF